MMPPYNVLMINISTTYSGTVESIRRKKAMETEIPIAFLLVNQSDSITNSLKITSDLLSVLLVRWSRSYPDVLPWNGEVQPEFSNDLRSCIEWFRFLYSWVSMCGHVEVPFLPARCCTVHQDHSFFQWILLASRRISWTDTEWSSGFRCHTSHTVEIPEEMNMADVLPVHE